MGYYFPKTPLYSLWHIAMLIGQDAQILEGLLQVGVCFLVVP